VDFSPVFGETIFEHPHVAKKPRVRDKKKKKNVVSRALLFYLRATEHHKLYKIHHAEVFLRLLRHLVVSWTMIPCAEIFFLLTHIFVANFVADLRCNKQYYFVDGKLLKKKKILRFLIFFSWCRTHDSKSVRRSHNEGWRHKENVRNYYNLLIEFGEVQLSPEAYGKCLFSSFWKFREPNLVTLAMQFMPQYNQSYGGHGGHGGGGGHRGGRGGFGGFKRDRDEGGHRHPDEPPYKRERHY